MADHNLIPRTSNPEVQPGQLPATAEQPQPRAVDTIVAMPRLETTPNTAEAAQPTDTEGGAERTDFPVATEATAGEKLPIAQPDATGLPSKAIVDAAAGLDRQLGQPAVFSESWDNLAEKNLANFGLGAQPSLSSSEASTSSAPPPNSQAS